MNGETLLDLFNRSTRRYHLLGDTQNGVVAGLDLVGRLFTIMNGTVANRVNPEALLNPTTRAAYLNPGGDGLWPAPEAGFMEIEAAGGCPARMTPECERSVTITTAYCECTSHSDSEIDQLDNREFSELHEFIQNITP